MTGQIHSIETFGTLDGPGIRFVLFLKGCPLRCQYCHNPDTWYNNNTIEMSVNDIVEKVLKYKKYYKDTGGITVSGGEPLLQIDFLINLFKILKEHNIHTAIDTSGCLFNSNNKILLNKFNELIKYTDLFLLDIKHINNEKHIELTGKTNKNILEFAQYLNNNNKRVWIRHVLVPQITDKDEYLNELKKFIDTLKNVEKVEVLPYHTLGINKYTNLGIDYKLKNINPPTKDRIENAIKILRR